MLERGFAKWSSRFLFTMPAIVIYSVMVIVPIVYSMYLSFFTWNGIATQPKVFAGLDNWTRLLHDETMRQVMINTFKLTFFALMIQLPAGMLFALLLTSKVRFGRWFKTIYFFPVMMSSTVLGILWGQIYDPNIGLLNALLTKLGLDHLVHVWLGEAGYALGSIIAVVAWQFIGFYVVVYYAALQTIPDEIIESAKMEGATERLIVFRIRIPLIWHVITFTILNCVINSFRYFDLIYIMTEGGPNGSSEVMSSYMYKQAFQFLDFGYGSSIAGFMFIFSLIVAVIIIRLLRRESYQN
ncbi:ABC transporter permease subunit [Cohnella sp. CFH 77786]|uniref:carbohydrate ABC transporter permease n=1 Tax=Cohnella sp. CFH 77786 TaxID=2662265 RepID=UPI001C60A74F|nr:sugar ABC transporter permease [Cohnella sp. CFH 77786]MBW5449413.1 ABC transporter permease subunit [Cohnella sp. CFH 77786]